LEPIGLWLCRAEELSDCRKNYIDYAGVKRTHDASQHDGSENCIAAGIDIASLIYLIGFIMADHPASSLYDKPSHSLYIQDRFQHEPGLAISADRASYLYLLPLSLNVHS